MGNECSMAGTPSSQFPTEAEMITAIRETRRPRRQQNTFYASIKVLGENLPLATETEPPSSKLKVVEDNLATA
jgi:hypothetical protein